MCPVCTATAGIVVSSVVSTGGLTALAVKIFGKRANSRRDLPEKYIGPSTRTKRETQDDKSLEVKPSKE